MNDPLNKKTQKGEKNKDSLYSVESSGCLIENGLFQIGQDQPLIF